MKQDIRSFKTAKKRTPNEKASDIFDKFDENTKREAKTIEHTLRQYEGKSEAELMGELTKMADAERRKGTLSNKKLEAFARSVSPMLTKEQQQRLASLLAQLMD